MKLRHLLFLLAAAGLTACGDRIGNVQSYTASPLPPTPASQPIDVVTPGHVPHHYTVIGQVSGYDLQMLEDGARKLGADAIFKPTSVDPVSRYATTDAIKYQKK